MRKMRFIPFLLSIFIIACKKDAKDNRVIVDPPMGDSLSLLTKVYVNDVCKDSIIYNGAGQPISIYFAYDTTQPPQVYQLIKREFSYDAGTGLVNRISQTTNGGTAAADVTFVKDSVFVGTSHYPISPIRQIYQLGVPDTTGPATARMVNYFRYTLTDNNETAYVFHGMQSYPQYKEFQESFETGTYTYDDKPNAAYWLYYNVPFIFIGGGIPEPLTVHSRNNVTKIVKERKDTVNNLAYDHYAVTTNTTTNIQYTYDPRYGVPLTADIQTQTVSTQYPTTSGHSVMRFEYKRFKP